MVTCFSRVCHTVVTMLGFYRFLMPLILLSSLRQANAGELTFELPDNEKMCFHEHVEKGVETVLEFQVCSYF